MDANAKAKGIQDALNNIRGKLGRPALAAEFLDAVLAAESGLDADLRGRFSCDRISVLRGINPVDAALVERRCRELAENAGIPGPYRAGPCGCCWRRSMARATRRNAPNNGLCAGVSRKNTRRPRPRNVRSALGSCAWRAKPATPRCAPPRRDSLPTATRRPQSGWTPRRTWPLR